MATADRWAPWVEPEIRATAAQVVNALGWTALPGATVTITPHVRTRLYITYAADVECTAVAAGGLFRARMNVGGVGSTSQVIYVPTAGMVNARMTLSGESSEFVLAANTTYTITLEAETNAAGGTYNVRQTNSRFCILGVPAVHLP